MLHITNFTTTNIIIVRADMAELKTKAKISKRAKTKVEAEQFSQAHRQ